MSRQTNNLSRSSCGFTIYGMLTSLVLLTGFMMLAMRLFGSSIKIVEANSQGQTCTARVQSIREQLRRDVWSSATIEVTAPGHLKLVDGDGIVTEWLAGDGHVLGQVARKTATDQREWTAPGKFEFRAATGGLAVTCNGSDCVLVSQLLIQERPGNGGGQ